MIWWHPLFWQLAFQSLQYLEAYVAQAKALALFETGEDGIGCEKTLTLVTCFNFFIIVSKNFLQDIHKTIMNENVKKETPHN